MLYLILAIISSAMVSIVMRVSEKKVPQSMGMIAVNYVMCILLAGYYMGFGNLLPKTDRISQTIALGVINGILYLLGFVFLQISVKRNGVVLSATFMKLGLLVPIIVSIVLFGESPKALQVIGFVFAIAAIILINFEKEQSEMNLRMGLFGLLLVGGFTDVMSKIYEETGSQELSEQFLFYTFVTAFLLCVLLLVYKKERVNKLTVIFGLLIGIPNYFSARFLLASLSQLPAVLVYPTYSVATILIITMAGVGVFKEKLGKRQRYAMGMIVVALLLLNL